MQLFGLTDFKHTAKDKKKKKSFIKSVLNNSHRALRGSMLLGHETDGKWLEGFIRGYSAAVVITAHHVLRCAAHINRSKQPLMGEPQGCHRNEQTIRLLTVPDNVTLNSTAETDMQRKGREEESMG